MITMPVIRTFANDARAIGFEKAYRNFSNFVEMEVTDPDERAGFKVTFVNTCKRDGIEVPEDFSVTGTSSK